MDVAIVVLVLVAGLGVLRYLAGRTRDERRSVEGYRHALHRLEDVAHRVEPSVTRTVHQAPTVLVEPHRHRNGALATEEPSPTPPSSSWTEASRTKPAAAAAAARASVSTERQASGAGAGSEPSPRGSERSGSDRPAMVFVDDALIGVAPSLHGEIHEELGLAVREPPVTGTDEGGGLDELQVRASDAALAKRVDGPTTQGRAPRVRRAWIHAATARRRARLRGNALARLAVGVVLAAILLAAGVAIGRASAHRSGAALSSRSPRSRATAASIARAGGTLGNARSHHGAVHERARSVPHTRAKAAGSGPIVPVEQTPTTARYVAPGGTYTLAITVRGPCWVMARSAEGTVLFTGTLQAGQSQLVEADGATTVELGAAWNAAVELNGVPVAFPVGFESPLHLSFEPA
jgi:hypothetical protein